MSHSVTSFVYADASDGWPHCDPQDSRERAGHQGTVSAFVPRLCRHRGRQDHVVGLVLVQRLFGETNIIPETSQYDSAPSHSKTLAYLKAASEW